MNCSKEEIERKRLEALAKRKSKIVNGVDLCSSNASASAHFSPQKCNKLSDGRHHGSWQTKISGPNLDRESYSSNRPIKMSPISFHPYRKPETWSSSRNSSEMLSTSPNKVVTGNVYLISEDRFEVNPSAFCAPLIDIFKSMPSRNYDSKSRLWSFLIEDYEALMDAVLPLRPDIVIGTLPSFVLKVLREPCVNPESIDLTAIEATLQNQLLPFQTEGVRFGIAKGGRCMIADDMGLGKTFQALAIAHYYKENWPLLIVTTSSMRDTWQQKIHELLPGTPMMNVVTLSGARDCEAIADGQTEVVIVSYKLTTIYLDLLRQKKFGFVIIDESHYLKSPKAQCTTALKSISRSARRVVLLSGTPALSRPAELYTQLAIIEPRLFNNYVEYGKRYCAGKLGNFGWDMSGQSNLAELQVLLQRRFLIRRTKEQVLTLQEKTRESVILDPSLMKVSKHAETELREMASRLSNTKSMDKQAALLTYFSESSRVKTPAICAYIASLVRDGTAGKFLVFAHHRGVVEAVCATLDEHRVRYVCIVGSTPAPVRAGLVEKFQLSDSCRCAVLSITAANAGITLTAAQLVVFAELHWNPGILTQAEARAHRIGQRGGVSIRYLLARGTSDDHMWPLLQHKLNVLNEVGLSKENFDDTACTEQERKNGIMQYLTSPGSSKNKDDYVPGTNIRKDSCPALERTSSHGIEESLNESSHRQSETDNVDRSFLEDEEGDDLLANLDL